MSRCRETAGILFKKRCQYPSTQKCGSCNKPVCRVHIRVLGPSSEVCISCARSSIEADPSSRRSYGHLQDDPYFFWYYQAEFFDPCGESDYGLFAEGGEAITSDLQDHWEGT